MQGPRLVTHRSVRAEQGQLGAVGGLTGARRLLWRSRAHSRVRLRRREQLHDAASRDVFLEREPWNAEHVTHPQTRQTLGPAARFIQRGHLIRLRTADPQDAHRLLDLQQDRELAPLINIVIAQNFTPSPTHASRNRISLHRTTSATRRAGQSTEDPPYRYRAQNSLPAAQRGPRTPHREFCIGPNIDRHGTSGCTYDEKIVFSART